MAEIFLNQNFIWGKFSRKLQVCKFLTHTVENQWHLMEWYFGLMVGSSLVVISYDAIRDAILTCAQKLT